MNSLHTKTACLPDVSQVWDRKISLESLQLRIEKALYWCMSPSDFLWLKFESNNIKQKYPSDSSKIDFSVQHAPLFQASKWSTGCDRFHKFLRSCPGPYVWFPKICHDIIFCHSLETMESCSGMSKGDLRQSFPPRNKETAREIPRRISLSTCSDAKS